MELLFATPVPPLAFKRRPHAFVRGLADRDHRIHLITQVPSEEAECALVADPTWETVRSACASVTLVRAPKIGSVLRCMRALPTSRPLRVAYCAEPRFVDRVEQLCREVDPDLVHVDRPRLAATLADVPVSKVLDATDALTPYLREVRRAGPFGERVLAALELRTMPDYEARMGEGYEATIVTTEAEAAALRELGAGGPVFVVPNGVEGSFLEVDRRPDPDRIVFVGGMYYPPNIDAVTWFVGDIWPRIRAHRPGARLDIVGAEPGPNVRRLQREDGVTVTGRVDDIAAHLATAAVAVAPVRIGGGFSNKLAEYLATGAPTVTTTAAADALPGLVPGEHLLTADDAALFADRVVTLLEDRETAERLGRRGRRLISASHRWDAALEHLERIYRGAVSR